MVINPFGNGADAFCTEDVKGRVSGFTTAIVEQLDDEARPLIRGDGYGAVGLGNVADCCLGSRREVEDSEADRGERTPSAREGVGVNGAVDGGGCGCWERGKEKLCTALYLPGLPGLGTHERGED